MRDDSISPDSSSSDDSSGASKFYVNLASLSVDGTAPEIGDEVEVKSVKGTVSSIEGDVACVSPTEIDGQPAPDMSKQDQSSPDDQRQSLRDQAGVSDGSSSY